MTRTHGVVQMPEAQKQGGERAAWNIPEWSAALDLGRSTFYTLKIRPRCIKVGKRTLVVESPADYARRIAALQAA
jgi:hypothetical protein